MSRKTFLITVAALFGLIAAGLVGGYFFLTNTNTKPDTVVLEGSGSLAENNIPDSSSSSENLSTTTPGVIPRVRHITTTPVAGYDFVDTPNGFVIWYIDRGNGNIFQTATSTLEITRITNTTIPKVYEAYIGKGGSNVVLRTLSEATDSIQTFIGSPKIKNTSSTSTDNTKELSGVFTGDTITALSLSPGKDRFFGMTGSNTGIGNMYSWVAKSSNVFSHPLKKWIPQWVNGSTILMTSAPSAKTQNIAYFLNPITRSFTKAFGPRNGLVVSSSPDGVYLMYSENKGDTPAFGLYNTKSGTETTLTNGTIPDKCVWSKKSLSLVYCGFPKNISSGIFPDDWYQGKTTFNDVIRSVSADTLRYETVSDLGKEVGVEIDAINLMLSSDEKYLMFTNKKDLTLWMVEL